MPTPVEIGVMGGTFNPIGTKSLIIAQACLDVAGLMEILFIPNGTPPHKKNDVLNAEDRYELVVAAIGDNPKFKASRVEIDRDGPSYTVDTLRILHEQYTKQYGDGGFRLNLIIGEDTVREIVGWAGNENGGIFKLAPRILIAPRFTADPAREQEWRDILHQAEVFVLDCPASAVSSTLIRDWIRQGRSVRYLVPPAVHAILKLKGHYKPAVAGPSAATPAVATPQAPIMPSPPRVPPAATS